MVGSSGTALGFLRCADLFRLELHCEASSGIAHRCNAIFFTINVAIFFDECRYSTLRNHQADNRRCATLPSPRGFGATVSLPEQSVLPCSNGVGRCRAARPQGLSLRGSRISDRRMETTSQESAATALPHVIQRHRGSRSGSFRSGCRVFESRHARFHAAIRRWRGLSVFLIQQDFRRATMLHNARVSNPVIG
jgi:hypothetical protein